MLKDLNLLPREAFREHLRRELLELVKKTQGGTLMATAVSTPVSTPVKPALQSVTVYLISPQAPDLLAFIVNAFDAKEMSRAMGSAGGMHAVAMLQGAKIIVGGGFQYKGEAHPAALHLYVPDVDATYQRALDLGATSLHEPADLPYGERGAGVADPFGNFWYLATPLAGSSAPESLIPSFHVKGADKLIDFLVHGLGGTGVEKHTTNDGTIVYAKVHLGGSTVELGEAKGPYQPKKTAIYLNVDDVDATYERALAAGATSISAPADQPYGDRNCGVTDPFGHVWYIASPVVKTL